MKVRDLVTVLNRRQRVAFFMEGEEYPIYETAILGKNIYEQGLADLTVTGIYPVENALKIIVED